MPVRAVATDVDGTLKNNDGEVTAVTAAALRDFHNAGGVVVVATGRPPAGVAPVVQQLHAFHPGLVSFVVCGEGASVFDMRKLKDLPSDTDISEPAEWDLVFRDWSPGEHAHAVINAMDCLVPCFWSVELKTGAIVEAPDYYLKMRDYDMAHAKYLQATVAHDPALKATTRAQDAVGWVRCIPKTEPVGDEKLLKLAQTALQRVATAMGDVQLGATLSPVRLPDGTGSVLFQKQGLDKSSGLDVVCELTGIAAADFCTFGDGDNDSGMLQWAGASVCPSNAKAAAKASASITSELDNDEDFIAHELSRMRAAESTGSRL